MEKAEKFLVPLFRVLLGLLFIVAGLQKVGEPESFAQAIENYRLIGPQLSSLFALCVPWLEILLGICLITGCLTRPAAFLAGGLALGFGFFVVSALARGLDVDCGCFTGDSPVSWLHVLLDVAMIGMAGTVFWKGAGAVSLDRTFRIEEQASPKLSKLAGVLGGLLLLGNLAYLGSKGLPTLPPPPLEPSATTGQVQLVFDPPVLNLGKVMQETRGQQGTATYKNLGTVAAHIVDVETSCGCTKPKLTKKTLLPGESSELSVTYNPDTTRGEFHQSVLLHVEGQAEPAALDVTGDVVPTVQIFPGLLKLEPGVPKVVRIESRRDGYVPKVTGFASKVPVKLRQIGNEKNGAIEVEVLATAPIPPPHGNATVWSVRIRLAEGPPCVLYVNGKGTP